MSVTIIKEWIDRASAQHIWLLEDSHGRKKQVQASILEGPEPKAFLAKEMEEFAAQELKIAGYLEQHAELAAVGRGTGGGEAEAEKAAASTPLEKHGL